MLRSDAERMKAAWLILLMLPGLGAPAARAADLREAARQGPVLEVIYTAKPVLPGIGPLIIRSDLVFVGQVMDQKARLSDNASTVLTDYTIEVLEILVDLDNKLAPGGRLTVTKQGGQMRVDGVAVHVESVDFPPLRWLVPYVFFLVATPGGYGFLGGAQGVWAVRRGRVWSQVPVKFKLPVRRLYNRYKVKDFYGWVRGTGVPPSKR